MTATLHALLSPREEVSLFCIAIRSVIWHYLQLWMYSQLAEVGGRGHHSTDTGAINHGRGFGAKGSGGGLYSAAKTPHAEQADCEGTIIPRRGEQAGSGRQEPRSTLRKGAVLE